MDIQSLHAAIAAVAPINGVSVPDPLNRATWVISFQASATPSQISAAQSALLAWVDDSLSNLIRQELLRRVNLVMPPNIMTLLTVLFLANLLTAAEKSAVSDYVNWLKAMYANAKTLITNQTTTYALDSNWTAVPATVTTLVASYTV